MQRRDTGGEGSSYGRGFGSIKSSLSRITLKVSISFLQCCSSKSRDIHDFSDPTLHASSVSSFMFLTIDFRLLCKTPPGFILFSIQNVKSLDGIYFMEFIKILPMDRNCLASVILRASGMSKKSFELFHFQHGLLLLPTQ